MIKKKKVIIGLSGGVDSSVAALLLLKEGYDVEAVFMRNWDSLINNDIEGNPNLNNKVCPQEEDYMDAVKVAEKLNIKLHRVDFIEEYWNKVFLYFLDEYKKGRTPNPDIMCNKEIKFKSFIDYAKDLNYDYIAMGHYAIMDHKNNHKLLKAKDLNKDQTYFLCYLSKKQLEKVLFPIGHLTKQEVRKIAKENDLITYNKKDSTGICFIGERHFKEFLHNYLPTKRGNIININNNKIIGTHDGLMYYTLGQRKGLNIGGLKDYPNLPWFVVKKDLDNNILYVAQGNDDILYSNKLIMEDVNFIEDEKDIDYDNITAKFRYRQPDIKVNLKKLDNNLYEISYPSKSRAVTPGQICCLYNYDICLGGGIIKEIYIDNQKIN